MLSRNLERAKLLQMRREPLRVEQRKFLRAQMFDQCDERDLGCVSFSMEHRLAKKRAADGDTVKSPGEFALAPRLDGVRVTELV